MVPKIKVSAPAQNPHICYINRLYKDKIDAIKSKTGLSLYNLLCLCGKAELKSAKEIKEFKDKLKKQGFKNIGVWAENLIDMLFSLLDSINDIDLTKIEIKRKEK